jgi:hypothetical protein
LRYHAVHEEEEEHKLEQLEVVRKQATKLINQLRAIFEQLKQNKLDILWKHFSKYIRKGIFLEYVENIRMREIKLKQIKENGKNLTY